MGLQVRLLKCRKMELARALGSSAMLASLGSTTDGVEHYIVCDDMSSPFRYLLELPEFAKTLVYLLNEELDRAVEMEQLAVDVEAYENE